MFTSFNLAQVKNTKVIKKEKMKSDSFINALSEKYSNNSDISELKGFKNTYIVDSLKEYIYLINSILSDYYVINKESKVKFRNKYIFRGLSSISEFDSKITRYNIKKLNDEIQYVRKFEENGTLQLGQFNNPLDLAAAADHYGTYTRLIDWSTSPLIATLFSLYKDSPGDYHAILFQKLNDNVKLKSLVEDNSFVTAPLYMRYNSMLIKLNEVIKYRDAISSQSIKKLVNSKPDEVSQISSKNPGSYGDDAPLIEKIIEYFKNILEKTYTNYSQTNLHHIGLVKKFLSKGSKIIIETNYSNERLVAQRGMFEIEVEKAKDFSKTSIILIKNCARKEILKYINKLGLNYYIIMNDPSNSSNYINTFMNNKIFDVEKIDYSDCEGNNNEENNENN